MRESTSMRLAIIIFFLVFACSSLIFASFAVSYRNMLIADQLSSYQMIRALKLDRDGDLAVEALQIDRRNLGLESLSFSERIASPALSASPSIFIDREKDTPLSSLFQTQALIWEQSDGLVRVSDRQAGVSYMLDIRRAYLQRKLQGFALSWLGATTLLALIPAFVIGVITYRSVLQPAQELTRFMHDLAREPALMHSPPHLNFAVHELRLIDKGLVALSHDIRAAFRQRERLADIGTAVAKINHDLRNILSSASLVSEALARSEDSQMRQAGAIVSRSTEQAVALCQNMLDYLTDTPNPEPVEFVMADLVAELDAGSTISVRYEGPAQVFADRILIKRLLLNLIRNADKAGAKNVQLDIWRAGHLCVIDVSDDGPGVPKDFRPFLFSAFHSGHRAGSGLGLAIAKDIAVAQQGDIKLSRSSENGSEFRLSLPLDIFRPAGVSAKTKKRLSA